MEAIWYCMRRNTNFSRQTQLQNYFFIAYQPERLINPSSNNVSFLYPLKTSENQMVNTDFNVSGKMIFKLKVQTSKKLFQEIIWHLHKFVLFRGYRSGTLVANELSYVLNFPSRSTFSTFITYPHYTQHVQLNKNLPYQSAFLVFT